MWLSILWLILFFKVWFLCSNDVVVSSTNSFYRLIVLWLIRMQENE